MRLRFGTLAAPALFGLVFALAIAFAAAPSQAGAPAAGPDSRRTHTPTGTPAPPPVCALTTPTRVPTPAFTPAAGCSDTPHGRELRAVITDHPTTTEARFTNRSATCSYPIGLATYRRFDTNIDHQELYDYRLAVIPPNSTLTLTVDNPPCAYQTDAFRGALIESFAGGVRYGPRLLTDSDGVNPTLCQHCVTPTATNTPTNTALPPTSTRTSTPGPSNTSTALPPTSTRTSTPGPSNTSTALPPTSTRTSTPGPSNTSTALPPTSTRTSTPGPSNTSTTLPPTSTRTSTPMNTPTPACIPNQTFTGAITANDPTHQNFVLFNTGGPSVCGVAPVCPGVQTDTSNYHYDTYTFTNTTGSPQCITVTVNATGCGSGSFGLASYAYLGTFDPNNLCAGYAGSFNTNIAPTGPGTYRFTVPAGQTFTVEIEEYVANSLCPSYTVTIGSCTP
jgi:hypothetical protein